MIPVLIEDKLSKERRVRRSFIKRFIENYKRIQRVKAFGKMRIEVKAKWERQKESVRFQLYCDHYLTGQARDAWKYFKFTVKDQYGDPSNSDSTVSMLFQTIRHKTLDRALWEYHQDNMETFDALNNPPPPPPPRPTWQPRTIKGG